MPYPLRSGRFQNGVLARCVTASGDGVSRATTDQETDFLVKIDRSCAQYQAIDLTKNTTTLFYARLVGPTIVPAYSDRVDRTTYRITYNVYDPGIYTLQVAVDFAAALGEGNPDFFSQETYFEGREIQGSPFTVAVHGPSRPSPNSLRLCEGEDIGGPIGRWVLERHPLSSLPLGGGAVTTRVNFLNATYTWQPLECRLPTWDCMEAATFERCYGGQKLKPFMFGDSVMLIQIRELKKQYNGTGQYGRWLEVEGVHLNSGLPVNMAKANASIESAALYHKATGGAAAIWFNSGLHDIDKFCGTAWREWRETQGFAQDFDCLGGYIRYIEQIIAKVEEVGFVGPKIVRTTTASWQRFGNHRIRWELYCDEEQKFLNSRYTVAVFNSHVTPLFRAAGWSIVDAYASTTSCPDASELKRDQPGAAFVHFEADVAQLHNRQMLAVTLMQQCPNVLQRECSVSSAA